MCLPLPWRIYNLTDGMGGGGRLLVARIQGYNKDTKTAGIGPTREMLISEC